MVLPLVLARALPTTAVAVSVSELYVCGGEQVAAMYAGSLGRGRIARTSGTAKLTPPFFYLILVSKKGASASLAGSWYVWFRGHG